MADTNPAEGEDPETLAGAHRLQTVLPSCQVLVVNHGHPLDVVRSLRFSSDRGGDWTSDASVRAFYAGKVLILDPLQVIGWRGTTG